MDDLIKTVAGKAGITAEQARQAVEAVLAFAKDEMPGPIDKQVTNRLSGGSAGGAGGEVEGQAGQAVEVLFGKNSAWFTRDKG